MAHHGAKPTLKAIKGGLADIPPLPASLPDCMADEWNVIAADLKTRKLLAKPMLGVLENYVRAVWTARLASAEIEKHGIFVNTAHQQLKANPATAVLKAAQGAVARFSAELGITPASRSRAGMGGEEKPEEDDPLGLD
jgi:P27 family predicted phage terminase small subunit